MPRATITYTPDRLYTETFEDAPTDIVWTEEGRRHLVQTLGRRYLALLEEAGWTGGLWLTGSPLMGVLSNGPGLTGARRDALDVALRDAHEHVRYTLASLTADDAIGTPVERRRGWRALAAACTDTSLPEPLRTWLAQVIDERRHRTAGVSTACVLTVDELRRWEAVAERIRRQAARGVLLPIEVRVTPAALAARLMTATPATWRADLAWAQQRAAEGRVAGLDAALLATLADGQWLARLGATSADVADLLTTLPNDLRLAIIRGLRTSAADPVPERETVDASSAGRRASTRPRGRPSR
jgi:hypothetical protein